MAQIQDKLNELSDLEFRDNFMIDFNSGEIVDVIRQNELISQGDEL